MSRKKYFCQVTKVANKESFPIHADSSTSLYLASDSIDVEKEREMENQEQFICKQKTFCSMKEVLSSSKSMPGNDLGHVENPVLLEYKQVYFVEWPW